MKCITKLCRIDGSGVIKVADFGLTEDMYGTNYFRRRKSEAGSEEKVPIRWMAPESIESDIYDESTDVVRTIMIEFICTRRVYTMRVLMVVRTCLYMTHSQICCKMFVSLKYINVSYTVVIWCNCLGVIHLW